MNVQDSFNDHIKAIAGGEGAHEWYRAGRLDVYGVFCDVVVIDEFGFRNVAVTQTNHRWSAKVGGSLLVPRIHCKPSL